jgi:hypothetical protein
MKPRAKLKPIFSTSPERGKRSMHYLSRTILRSVQPLNVPAEQTIMQHNKIETVGKPLLFYFR